jgi:RNA polymerase sigma-70 factor (ECF subfamily)
MTFVFRIAGESGLAQHLHSPTQRVGVLGVLGVQRFERGRSAHFVDRQAALQELVESLLEFLVTLGIGRLHSRDAPLRRIQPRCYHRLSAAAVTVRDARAMSTTHDRGEWNDSRPSIARGDRVAIDALLLRHLDRLRAFVRLRAGPMARAQDDTGDLVQSVCRELLAKACALQFSNDAAFRHWLFTEALRKIQKRARHHAALKRDVRLAERLDSSLVACYSAFASPSAHAAAREQVERVEAAFDALPERDRELVSLAFVVGLSRAEIGNRLGTTEGAVRTALHRALARLAARLDRDDAET